MNQSFVAIPSQKNAVRFWLIYDSDKLSDVSSNEFHKKSVKDWT